MLTIDTPTQFEQRLTEDAWFEWSCSQPYTPSQIRARLIAIDGDSRAGSSDLAVAACGGGQTPIPTPTPTDTPPPTITPPMPPEQPPPLDVNLKDSGGRDPFTFEPADLTFRVGETVTLLLKSEAQYHTFTVEALGIDIDVDGGKTERLTYTFDKPGTYDLICIPHQTLGMTGTITVEPTPQ